MNAIVQYAPLAAILSPVLVLAGLNAWLALSGEKGTLMLPSGGAYPAVNLPGIACAAPADEAGMEDQVAFEEELRKAA